jgi:C4-dicarboxylate-specific signal transduction histidine kinase
MSHLVTKWLTITAIDIRIKLKMSELLEQCRKIAANAVLENHHTSVTNRIASLTKRVKLRASKGDTSVIVRDCYYTADEVTDHFQKLGFLIIRHECNDFTISWAEDDE